MSSKSAVTVDPELLSEIGAGLARRPRELPPRFFYDERGSRLFERITRQPEYYLTRTERTLLHGAATRWVRSMEPRSLVELGAGNADKTRTILDAMTAIHADAVYVPIDVSAAFLEESARRLRDSYPRLQVEPLVADITRPLQLERTLPGPVLAAFLGSTLGNFDDGAARALLAGLRSLLHAGDRLLLGADLRKDRATLEAAYNDAEGVTAEFNLNMLRVLNLTLGANFDPTAFRHVARWNPEKGRVEMLLVSVRLQAVHIPGLPAIHLEAGEEIRTEISSKYDRPRLERILSAAGFDMEQWATDAEQRYAVLLAAPAPTAGPS